MHLETESYLNQQSRWPSKGSIILAQHDAESVVVYQAYRPSIGHFAAKHGYFGGGFSLSRMTWIKPNFLWMMYRSGWGRKEGQEVVLAIRIQRSAFDSILSQAVYSKYIPELYESPQAWKRLLKTSDVRLQWDPDHSPVGERLERRAIQLGLRGEAALRYSREWIIEIEDISAFVAEQRHWAMAGDYDRLVTPSESLYCVQDPAIMNHLQLAEGSF